MTDDELDHALFSLPLATPPAGLRESIVALTVRAEPVAAPARSLVLNAVDIVVIGIAMALATWLVMSGVGITYVESTARTASLFVERAGGEATILIWVSVGCALAALTAYASRFDIPLRRS